jgi:hypothetical protein
MGFFSDLFGDEEDRDRAMARAFAQYRTEMTQYLSQFEDRFSDIISMVESDRDVDIAAFTEGFQTAIDNYQEGVIDQLAAGFGEARGLMEQGFDQTLEDIQRQTEAASLRSLAQGALSGVSGTGFGQAQTEAIRAEGERELRRADESFRREMSNLAISEAGALADAESNMTNLLVQSTTGESDLRRAYTASISGLQSTLAQTMLAGGQSIADAGFQTGMGRAQNIGSGFNLGSVLVGAGASALTGGLAGGFGAKMLGGEFGEGFYATLMGGGGDYFKELTGGDS